MLQPLRGGRFGMDAYVELGEFHVAQHAQAAVEVLGRQHLVEQRPGQGLAGVDMGTELRQHLPLPAKVLHELTGQFHRVPLDA